MIELTLLNKFVNLPVICMLLHISLEIVGTFGIL